MCGFSGFLAAEQPAALASELLLRMGDAIAHRGPDDQGIWYQAEQGIGFSHRRLAIVDLSPAGHQPMQSQSQRYMMAFNGEIYNHHILRTELMQQQEPLHWRGHSDTETILAAFDAWGIEQTINRLVGMFSIAVWDLQQQELVLVRDRLGEKPLYFGWQEGVFLFGSELKALRIHPAFNHRINRDALALYMQYSYVPAPYSIYQSVQKLKPGCFLRTSLRTPGQVSIQPYWDLVQVNQQAQQQLFQGSDTEIISGLQQKIRDSVQSQLMSDVPVGAFLSGGVDSSLIVGVMQSLSASSVKTFTIGFEQQQFDEAQYAGQVAAHLNTDHNELYISDRDALEVVPKLAAIYDEPFADSSQIPTYLVSALAKSRVTVALSGDAGDELFAGYSRYQHCMQTWHKFSRRSATGRAMVAGGISQLSAFQWNNLSHLVGYKPEGGNIGHRLAKVAMAAKTDNFVSYYQNLLSHLAEAQQLVLKSAGSNTVFNELSWLEPGVSSLMLVDSLSYLPDDILAKVDRASMAVSLESRIPLLDYRVVEFAQKMPFHLKYQHGQTKWCLRQILDQYVPRNLIDRPKKGFGVPLAEWLRGPLKDWAEVLVQSDLLRSQGYLNADVVGSMWQQHQQGIADWHFQLWNVLMFQSWLQQQGCVE